MDTLLASLGKKLEEKKNVAVALQWLQERLHGQQQDGRNANSETSDSVETKIPQVVECLKCVFCQASVDEKNSDLLTCEETARILTLALNESAVVNAGKRMLAPKLRRCHRHELELYEMTRFIFAFDDKENSFAAVLGRCEVFTELMNYGTGMPTITPNVQLFGVTMCKYLQHYKETANFVLPPHLQKILYPTHQLKPCTVWNNHSPSKTFKSDGFEIEYKILQEKRLEPAFVFGPTNNVMGAVADKLKRYMSNPGAEMEEKTWVFYRFQKLVEQPSIRTPEMQSAIRGHQIQSLTDALPNQLTLPAQVQNAFSRGNQSHQNAHLMTATKTEEAKQLKYVKRTILAKVFKTGTHPVVSNSNQTNEVDTFSGKPTIQEEHHQNPQVLPELNMSGPMVPENNQFSILTKNLQNIAAGHPSTFDAVQTKNVDLRSAIRLVRKSQRRQNVPMYAAIDFDKPKKLENEVPLNLSITFKNQAAVLQVVSEAMKIRKTDLHSANRGVHGHQGCNQNASMFAAINCDGPKLLENEQFLSFTKILKDLAAAHPIVSDATSTVDTRSGSSDLICWHEGYQQDADLFRTANMKKPEMPQNHEPSLLTKLLAEEGLLDPVVPNVNETMEAVCRKRVLDQASNQKPRKGGRQKKRPRPSDDYWGN